MMFKENKELIDIAHLLTGIDERRAEHRPARKLAEDIFLKLYYISSMETSMVDDVMSHEESDKFEGPYPLTITLDRYSGVYSGGLYVAWNCDADAVPTEPSDDDVTCADFWDRAEQDMLDGDIPCYGIGVNPEKAILNLVETMLAKEMKEESEWTSSLPLKK